VINQLAILLQGQIGESDCETIQEGLIAQPVNAFSSGAYILAGIWLISRAARMRSHETATQMVFGVALASVGVGSIAFHGPTPPGARLLHDLTIASVFALIAARNAGILREWTEATVLMVFAVVTAITGGAMAVAPNVGNAVGGVVGVGAVATEAYLYWTRRRGGLSRRTVRWLAGIVVLFAVAGIINLLGRTDAPLCEPGSLFQGHALWHGLTAVAFALYGFVTFSDQHHAATRPTQR
jgi:hypothetical protein